MKLISPLYLLINTLLLMDSISAAQSKIDPHENKMLTVFAAASLSEAFQSLGKNFETTHTNTSIRFNFGGSQQLVQQLAHGAPADVFASANAKQMDVAVKSGRIDSASVKNFVGNHLIIVTPKDNPAGISSIHNLSKPRIKIVFADKSVPAGQYALDVLERCSRSDQFKASFREDVLKNVVSYEENVRVVLSKVVLGEADAGIVYTSDISRTNEQRIRKIVIPDSLNVTAEYPIAAVRDSKSARIAKEFIDYVLSEQGQTILRQFGFLPINTPPAK
jgi:molybdate transport system substrate-binding protein